MSDVVVLGGGLLGAAVARAAAAAGRRVTVASRHPRTHAGLWRRYLVGGDGRPGWLAAGARVVLAVQPGAREDPDVAWGAGTARMLAWLVRDGHEVVAAGPCDDTSPSGAAFAALVRGLPAGVVVLRVPALFGADDRYAAPLLAALRAGRPATLPRLAAPAWPLAVDDAARAALQAPAGAWPIRGPERLTPEELGERLVARFGGQVRRGWTNRGHRVDELRRAALQTDPADAWDDATFGPRTRLDTWLGALPGAARRR